MGQTADELRNQIEHQRQELGENLQQLEEKVKSTVDWRTQFEQKPWAGVGVAFAGGFLLSILMPSGGSSSGGGGDSSSKTQSSNYMANYRVMDDSQRWGQMGGSGTSSSSPAMGFSSGGSKETRKSSSPEMSEITETLENIRGAVMGLAATRLRGFLAEAVPGFEDEYEQARTRRGASTSSKIDSTSSSSSGSSGGSSQSQTQSHGSSTFASTGSQPGGSSSFGGSVTTATTPPSQTHDADTPLAGYIGSTEGTSTSQPNDSYRS